MTDTNLIHKDSETLKSKKSKEKYLVKGYFGDPDTWCLVFRVPQRFGGKLIRQSLYTDDIEVARSIRDKFIIPILTESSAIAALEGIGKSIIQSQGAALEHLSQLKNIIMASEGLKLGDAHQKYIRWMKKNSGFRDGTIKKYTDDVAAAIEVLGKDRCAGMLSKEDAVRLREKLKSAEKSATTINNVFSTFRGFLRWLKKEGLMASPYVVDNFLIDLPPVRKENTAIVPPSKADDCMNCVKEWTMTPRIGRYTGMRIGEIMACCSNYKGCKIVKHEGILCFQVSKEFSKTHEDRYIPVCEKLMPFMTKANIKEVAESARNDRTESPAQKKYNRNVKKIESCEKVSFHSWRVYANTMMMEAGVDELLCKRIVGHSDPSNVHYGYTAGRLEAMKAALDKIP